MGAGMRRNSSIFQSTLPQGERQKFKNIFKGIILFQSTLPQGERPIQDETTSKFVIFQSTLPQGERPYVGSYLF